MSEPQWVQEYIQFGFSEDWLKDIKDKHGRDLLEQLGEKSNPVNFYEIKPLSIEENPEIISNIYVPQGYTLSEVLLFVLDCLNCLGENAPSKDSEIYELYAELTIKEKLSFAEFYAFIRNLKHIDITKTQQYSILSNTVEYYTLKTIPLKNSVWVVPYEDGKIEVEVIQETTKSKLNIHDEKIKVSITDIIERANNNYIQIGDKIKLKPYAFNNGKHKKMRI